MGIRLVLRAYLHRRITCYQQLPYVCQLIGWERRGHPIIQYSGVKYLSKRPFHLSSWKHLKFEVSGTKLVRNMDASDTLENQSAVDEANNVAQSDGKPAYSQSPQQPEDGGAKPLSKKALKRLARAQKHKEYKRQKKAQALQMANKDDAGYNLEDLEDSSYYFENGLRKVYPYQYVFATHAKGRWVGRTIQDVLEREFGFDQQEHLDKAFENGMIHVNNQQASPDYVLQENDYIAHKTHRHENPVTAAPIEILENNNEVVVINKPSSIPCHPCGRYRFNSVVFILGKDMGLTNLRNIYRLDRLTSGILIMGKSLERTRVLMEQVSKRQVQKEYVCRVVGKFPDGTVKVDQPLQALSNKLRLQIVSPSGKSSQTTFTRLSYNGKSSVVRCIPHTGRTHQIRVHLQYLGHPIINDAFYNNDAWGPSKGKGANYEVPFEEVCTRILTEHHVNLWDGGDNPLYQERLQELEATRGAGLDTSQDRQSQRSEPNNSQTAGTSGGPFCVSQGDIESHEVLETNQEPPSKRRREENTDAGSHRLWPQSPNMQGASALSENTTENRHLLTGSLRTAHLSINPETGEDSVDYSEAVQEASVRSASSCVENCATTSHTPSALESPSQLPGFERSKWIIDPTCELCKKQLIDPKEKNLVMFLHAIKYQGPGWKYETAMPDWARDDWQREEEFGIDDLNFSDLS